MLPRLSLSLLAGAAVLALSTPFLAPSAATTSLAANTPSSSTMLASENCAQALRTLGNEQRKALASTVTLDAAAAACSDSSLTLPKAQYAAVTLNGNTVGGVFSFTKPSRLLLPNQTELTFLLLNGHTILTSEDSDVYYAKNRQGTIALGGTTYSATISAVLSDGGSRVDVRLTGNIGTINKATATAASRPYKAGTSVTIYTNNGPVTTIIGQPYKNRWQTVEGHHYGIATLTSGQYIGRAGWFGTNYEPGEETRFWNNHSLLTRYKK